MQPPGRGLFPSRLEMSVIRQTGADMTQRRLRTAKRKKRAKAQFWDRHGGNLRLTAIGACMVAVASAAAWMLLSLT
jgi:hypothetical protein